MARHDLRDDRTDGSEQVTRYEDLRRHVTGDGCGHRLGMALFHREGMKAWLDAWSTCSIRDARPVRNPSDGAVRPLPLAGEVGAVVRQVASMAMATLQNVVNVNSGQLPQDFSS